MTSPVLVTSTLKHRLPWETIDREVAVGKRGVTEAKSEGELRRQLQFIVVAVAEKLLFQAGICASSTGMVTGNLPLGL